MTSSSTKRELDLQFNEMASGSNGTKRRCTMSMNDLNPSPTSTGTKSNFQNSFLSLPPLTEHIASLIKDELRLSDDELNDIDLRNDGPILSIRQTHNICENLIKQRESKLRECYEYDRKLVKAEMFEIIHKANLFNSVESRVNASLLNTPNNTSLDAVSAAASAIQRLSSTCSLTGTSMPDLNSLAYSLSANGDNHHNNLTPEQILAIRLQQHQTAANAVAQHRQSLTIPSSIPGPNNFNTSGPVLLVSNLDPQLATPEALFTLFGVFGDVIRVKILYNKKDNALIQMADPNQAHVAQTNLDKQRIYGKTVRVTRSKHQSVQMPRDSNQAEAGLTKDFTNSPLHRFKIPGSRNYLNIYPPSDTLHISNIPATIEEEDIKQAFKEACTFDCSSFKFFPKDRKMAIMKFSSIEQATIALIKMHNFQISQENNLRVSYSKSVMYHQHIH